MLLLALSAPLPASAAAGTPVVGEGFELTRLTLSLQPDFTSGAVAGSQSIRFDSMSDGLQRLVFSPNALDIRNARLDGKPVAVASTPAGIVFELPEPMRAAQRATLTFDYAGVPARGLHRTGDGFYTRYFACDWMVCLQDAPGDKAEFNLDLRVPAGMESMGVGAELPRRALPDGLVLHRWRSTRPYSAYVFGFAAGTFPKLASGAGFDTFTYLDGTGTARDLGPAFAQTPAIAAFFADKAGIPLPDHRYGQLLVDGDAAQEAASFSLIGVDHLDRDLADPSSSWVIAHELAHQWWGNLVTCASWQEFWLNEGMATFMTAAWKENAFGADAYRRELDRARSRLEKARAAGFDKPLAWSGKYPALGLRRAVQYGKGALFLDHLRTDLGEEVFWRGIRDYSRRHAGGTVTSRDLQRAMEQASGRDLQPVFAQWVYGDAPGAARTDSSPAH